MTILHFTMYSHLISTCPFAPSADDRMARRSQCSSAGDNPLDPNYLPPHYREEYRLAIDALIEEDLESYYHFLQKADVVDFLSSPEIQYIQESVQLPQEISSEQRYAEISGDGSSDTYWPIHSDLDAPGLDLGWPQLHSFVGPTEITTLVNPPEPDMPSIKEQARRLIKNAQQVDAPFKCQTGIAIEKCMASLQSQSENEVSDLTTDMLISLPVTIRRVCTYQLFALLATVSTLCYKRKRNSLVD